MQGKILEKGGQKESNNRVEEEGTWLSNESTNISVW